MNNFKKLTYDARTYKDLIKGYTSDPFINQTAKNLVTCLEEKDHRGVLLFLERLKNWYNSNIQLINDNSFTLNKDSHNLACNQINEYFDILEDELTNLSEGDEVFEERKVGEKGMEAELGYKIFISHSSKDENICTAFVHLLEILGVPEQNILYSSSERFGIPADMDIFDYLRSSIVERFTVFYMLSDNYYNSVYCLNEMGAAWINQNDYSIYLLPSLSRSIDGVINSSKKGYRLDNMINLNQLRTKISNDFNFTISDNKWDEEKERFLSIIREN
jgi:hypothetical protein